MAKAVAKMDEVLNQLQSKLRRSVGRTIPLGATSQRQPATSQAAAAGFGSLCQAVSWGITVSHIPLESAFPGRAMPGIGSSTINNVKFTDYAYRSVPPFQWVKSEDADGNRYLFWKNEEDPAHVPAFDTRGRKLCTSGNCARLAS